MVAILNFSQILQNTKNACISTTVRHIAISPKFLTHRHDKAAIISPFSGRFVFAIQKQSRCCASDPVVI